MTPESVADIASLAELITTHRQEVLTSVEESRRLLVAIAGPPASGKSTLADQLAELINQRMPASGSIPVAAVFGMDGFHLDNTLLDAAGLRSVKGAPETFDVDGFFHTVQRLVNAERRVAIPVFDRAADFSRAAAAWIEVETSIIVVEGNYLLLDRPGWRELSTLFDITVGLDVAESELRRRLIDRWLQHGHDEARAIERAEQNDLTNAKLVMQASVAPQYVLAH